MLERRGKIEKSVFYLSKKIIEHIVLYLHGCLFYFILFAHPFEKAGIPKDIFINFSCIPLNFDIYRSCGCPNVSNFGNLKKKREFWH